ncbi:MAG TPA: transposase [Bryobacteraceae bacterium]|nr:transposase [Bryobacteraceae bacterium]
MDRILDRASTGPRHLCQPEIAGLVVEALRDGDHQLHRYELHSFAVMANHVHVLVTPHVVARQWLGPLKGFIAHEANRILGRRGRHFWQDESYDHVARSDAEFDRIRAYIENNPVTAGMVAAAEDFR